MPFISATFHYSLTLCFLLLSVSPFTDWLLISWLMNEYLFVIFCYLWKCVWYFSRLFVSSYPVCANIFFEIENNFSDFYKWVSLCRAKRDWLTQRLTSNKRENQLLYSLFVYSFVHWYSMWMVESHSEYKDIDPDIRRENIFYFFFSLTIEVWWQEEKKKTKFTQKKRVAFINRYKKRGKRFETFIEGMKFFGVAIII